MAEVAPANASSAAYGCEWATSRRESPEPEEEFRHERDASSDRQPGQSLQLTIVRVEFTAIVKRDRAAELRERGRWPGIEVHAQQSARMVAERPFVRRGVDQEREHDYRDVEADREPSECAESGPVRGHRKAPDEGRRHRRGADEGACTTAKPIEY